MTTCMTVTKMLGNPNVANNAQMNPPVMKLTNNSNNANGKNTASWIGSSIVLEPVPLTGVISDPPDGLSVLIRLPETTVHVPLAVVHSDWLNE